MILGDLGSSGAHPADLFPAQRSQLRPQLPPRLDELIGVGHDPMCGSMGPHKEIPPQRVALPGPHADKFEPVLRVLEPLVNLHERPKIVEITLWNVDGSGLETLELALSGVERNPRGVIEMSMRHEDVRNSDEDIGTSPDIECHVQLTDAKVGLIPGT